MAAQVSSQPSSHSRKSRFSWVRKLVSTSRSSHSKTSSSSPPPYASSHALTTHSQIDGMSPVTTTSSSLAPLYNHSSTSHQRTYSRDESLRTPSILTTSTSASVNSGPYRISAYHTHSRRRASSGIVDDRSSVDSNASLSLSTTSGANGNYVYGNVFASATTSAGTMTPHPSKRHLQAKLTPSITTTTTGTTTSRRSPSILSSSSTNNTSLMTLPPGFNHVTTSTTNSINTSTSNYYYTDNASVITLASSSKRRRKSIDTNASTRALAPDSLFGGSRESLPLTVATGGGASSFGRSVSVPAYGPGSGRRSTSGSRRTTRTEEYDSGTESCSEDEIGVTGEHATLNYEEHDNAGARCEKTSVELIGRGRSPVAASTMA
ncbi:hypothetical protein V1517DRAFT_329471 [Lipomyces orientalis]|uniref:Uncharacterized protein n=1 Tax=Lipomyces orientalis TaxID=1233043 RepID=A0ACC3TGV2_9ASCO